MAGIRVNSGVIRVEVNDNGDTIVLRKDFNFVNNVVSFADGLGALQKEFNDKAAQIAPDDADAKLDLLYSMHKELHDALEVLFGEGTCRKVFGDGEVDVIPTLDAVSDFCEQINPFIVQIAKSLGGTKPKVAKPAQVVPVKPQGYMGSAPAQYSAFSSLRQRLDSGDGSNEV